MEYRACEGSDPAPKNLPSFDFARRSSVPVTAPPAAGGRNQSWGGFSRLGANAVVGIDLDYQVLGDKNGMLMVTVCGTAVTLDP